MSSTAGSIACAPADHHCRGRLRGHPKVRSRHPHDPLNVRTVAALRTHRKLQMADRLTASASLAKSDKVCGGVDVNHRRLRVGLVLGAHTWHSGSP